MERGGYRDRRDGGRSGNRGSYGGSDKGAGRDCGGRQRRRFSENADRVRDELNEEQGGAGGVVTSGHGSYDRREDWVPQPPHKRLNFHSTGGGAACSATASLARSQIHEPARPIVSSPRTPDSDGMSVPRRMATAPFPAENYNRLLPMKRPDNGGYLKRSTVKLLVNHFPVNFNPNSVIRHYNIEVKPVESSLSKPVDSSKKPLKLPKTYLSAIREKLFTEEDFKWPLSKTAYDGEKNIYSVILLPEGEVDVELSDEEDIDYRKFKISIKLVNVLRLCKLRDYLTSHPSVKTRIPYDVLQGMTAVMKENPVMHMISVGRSFHPAEFHPQDELRHGITASRGIQHSLRPTFQGLALCLDYSVLALRKKMPVIKFLEEHIPGFKVSNFERYRKEVERALRGLKVNVTHRRTKQKYDIVGLSNDNTSEIVFFDANAPQERVLLVDYFRNKYKKNISHRNIPCLDCSKNNRINFVPMEFCVLAEGQVYPKESLDIESGKLLKGISFAKPWERKSWICDMVRSKDGPCGGNVIQNFEIDVVTEMTSVIGRVIQPPVLKTADPFTGRSISITVRDNCQWNLVGKAVAKGEAIDRWAVIEFSNDDKRGFRCDQFIKELIAKCHNLGMKMKEPFLYKEESMKKFSDHKSLYQLLNSVASIQNLQFILCVMSRKHDGYNYLKWVAETQIGVVTQCCLSKEVGKKGKDQYLSNLAMKINAKLGGSNVELNDPLPHFEGEGHVMFLGADVNHPVSHNKTSPSIAAVVATVNWPKANRYAARLRPQYHLKEKIEHFGLMCLELLETYARLNKVLPQKIVLFRDGVSESQFHMVLNEELTDLKNRFGSIRYFPTITVIVAQKRHHTRFFQESPKDGAILNISPGTVVDTKVVHPFEFDFYLCSHHGCLGTSKPTHYHVLWDENGFSSDKLQQLIYNLCFTFARCTKPVSLVPPVYYADLVAYRGRLYYQAIESSTPSAVSLEDWFTLTAGLKDEMFFV